MFAFFKLFQFFKKPLKEVVASFTKFEICFFVFCSSIDYIDRTNWVVLVFGG